MYHPQPALSPSAGPRGAHRRQAALTRTAAAVSRLTTKVNVRPIMRGAVLAAASTGTVAALALGPSAPSFAAARAPVVSTTNQAGYQVGNNDWNFRFVQAVMTLPRSGCADLNGNNNYRNSGVQLIGAANVSAAVGVACINAFVPHYIAGWTLGYSGNTFPSLTHLASVQALAGHKILLQLYYDLFDVHFTAVDKTTGKTLVSDIQPADAALYKQAVLSADVANPLPHPPPPGTSAILVPFTAGAVTTYNGRHGTGINGPWGVQQEQAVSGAHVIANAPLLYNSGTTFNVRIHG